MFPNVIQRYFQLTRCLAASLLIGSVCHGFASADTVRIAETGGYIGITEIDGGSKNRFLAQRSGNKVDVLSCQGTTCRVEASFEAPGKVWASAELATGTAVAFGYGKDMLSAPVSVEIFDGSFSQRKKVFEQPSERSQINFLRYDSGKLWLSFFKSKFETVVGILEDVPGGLWQFRERSTGRLEDAVDVHGEMILTGRPYGDGDGQDGDARMRSPGTEMVTLPTFRGARAVRFFDTKESKHPTAIIADGWHQNYGKLAQGRLTLLQFDEKLQRYGAFLIKRDPLQYGYSRLLAPRGKLSRFFALGNKNVELITGPRLEQVSTIATATTNDAVFEAALVTSTDKGAVLAVFNGTLDVVSVSFE